MPTNRTRIRRHAVGLGAVEIDHLLEGLCLLAGGCELCHPAFEGTRLDLDRARVAWRERRDELLAAWPHPFPPLAAVLFDGAAWPKPGRGLNEAARRAYQFIDGAIDSEPERGRDPSAGRRTRLTAVPKQ